MTIKNNIAKIVVPTLLLGSLIGCGDSEYHFDGKIGDEHVRYYEKRNANDYLEITKKDGTKIILYQHYFTTDFGKKLSSIKIQKKGEKEPRIYMDESEDKIILDRGYALWNKYREKILNKKSEEKKIKHKRRIKKALEDLE